MAAESGDHDVGAGERPGTVTFGNVNAVDTSATFSAAGTCVLRLTANDGQFAPFDEVTVTVNPAPANLLTNPGFESGGTGWQNITHAGRSVVTTQFHSGLSAARSSCPTRTVAS